MDIKELRVGNIVRLKDHFVGGNAMVTGIMKDRITSVNSVGTNIDSINIMYIEPIPITEELLLKCGLLKSHYSEKIFTIEGESCVGIYYVEGKVFDIRRDSDRASITCKYLHQLQNAYYLATGKELEIKL